MKSRRSSPITNAQAAFGTLVIVAVIGAIVGLSYLLLLDVDVEVSLPAAADPVASLESARQLANPPCPSGADLRRRGDPVEVTSSELVDCAHAFEGERVSYEGEAVGVVLRRGERAWLHVNDDPYGVSIGPLPTHRVTVGGNAGMAVSVPVAAAASVQVGDFRHRGTGLKIVGTFVSTHPDDAGSPAIHAESVEMVSPAQRVEHVLSTRRLLGAALAAVVTLTLGAVRWRQSRA